MRLRCLPMSIPSSRRARTANSLGGKPSTAPTPAETTRKSLRPFVACRNKPSAMGLRQMLPVQTNRTVFIPTLKKPDYTADATSSRQRELLGESCRRFIIPEGGRLRPRTQVVFSPRRPCLEPALPGFIGNSAIQELVRKGRNERRG